MPRVRFALPALALTLFAAGVGWSSCAPVGDATMIALDAGAGACPEAGSQGGSSSGAGSRQEGGAGAVSGAGGVAAAGGAAGIEWKSLSKLGSCEIQQALALRGAASRFFVWEPCSVDAACEVAKPDYKPWVDGVSGSQYLTRGSSLYAGSNGPELAIRVGVGRSSRLLLMDVSGVLRAAFREANPDDCLISITGLSETELGMLNSGTGPNGTSIYSTIRLDRASLAITEQAEVSGFHPYAIAEFSPDLFTATGWLAKQAGEDFWSLQRNGKAEQVVTQLTGNAVGRSAAHFMGDGRFAYSELRNSSSGFYDVIIVSDWKSSSDLIGTEGDGWGSARWTGDGVALLRGYDRVDGSYVLYDRTELWFGTIPEDGSMFAPELIGVHATGGAADGWLGEGATAGHGHYIAALPPTADVPGGQERYRSFSIWNIAARNRRAVQLEAGEALAGFLGVTTEYVYVLITDSYQPNYLKRFKLKSD